MQSGSQRDRADLVAGEAVLVALFHQAGEQHSRQASHMVHMRAALPAAKFHRAAENGGGQSVAPLLAADLPRNLLDHLFFPCVERQGILDAAAEDAWQEGTADIVRRAQSERAFHVRVGRVACDHDDRRIRQPLTALHLGQHIEAVRLRHHNVQQDKVDLPMVAAQHLDGLRSVGGLHEIVVRLQIIDQYRTVQFRIVRDQYSLSSVSIHCTAVPLLTLR